MSDLTHSNPESTVERLDEAGRRRMFVVLGIMLFNSAVLFVSADTINWPAAWIHLAISVGSVVVGGIYVIKRNPAAINERGRGGPNTKGFDKVFMVVYTLASYGSLVVCGLDYGRFGWSNVSLWLQIAAIPLLIFGAFLTYWAMEANRFLATTVRIQTERDHYVITGGPYRYVRHPMYIAGVITWLATPLLLGSWWGLLLGAVTALSLVVRTALEDRTLQAELPGYVEFTQRTRYRLVPGIW